MPDLHGPWDGSTFGQGPFYRDRGPLEASGVVGAPAASAAAGELGLTAAGFALSLSLGRAHVRGAAYERTGTAWTYTVPANTNPTQARIDLLVLRRDLVAKTVTPVVLQGTPAAAPVPPAMTQVEDGTWDEPLHEFTVPANSGTPLVIRDRRRWITPGRNRGRLGGAALSGGAGPSGTMYQIGQTSPIATFDGEVLRHSGSVGLYAAASLQTVTLVVARFSVFSAARTVVDSVSAPVGGGSPDDGTRIPFLIEESPPAGSWLYRIEAATNIAGGTFAYVAYGNATYAVDSV
jgi:hypothetical protein